MGQHIYVNYPKGCSMSASKEGVVYRHSHAQGAPCFFDAVAPQPISWKAP